MKTVILAGGLGTRLSEETVVKPKPMVEIGGKPILWHIMKIYSHYGQNDFVICLGYKGYMIKEYFFNYIMHNSNITIDLNGNSMEIHDSVCEPWKVTLVDTGDDTMTGGRVKKIEKFIDEEEFMLTYGDGVADIDISNLIKFHRNHHKKATLTSVLPPGRWGMLDLGPEGDVARFIEKPVGDGAWINGGFFVLQKSVFDYIEDDSTVWEKGPLEKLANEGQLMAYKHQGFWHPMDTLRDKIFLNDIWSAKKAPWKLW